MPTFALPFSCSSHGLFLIGLVHSKNQLLICGILQTTGGGCVKIGTPSFYAQQSMDTACRVRRVVRAYVVDL